MRLVISLFGRDLLGLEISHSEPTAAPAPATEAQESQPAGEAPGPVTDRRGGPVTQIGFTSSNPRKLT